MNLGLRPKPRSAALAAGHAPVAGLSPPLAAAVLPPTHHERTRNRTLRACDFCLTALIAGLDRAATANADTLADIKARGKLTVGVEAGGTGAILSSDSIRQDRRSGRRPERARRQGPGRRTGDGRNPLARHHSRPAQQPFRHDHERHDGHQGARRAGQLLHPVRRRLAGRGHAGRQPGQDLSTTCRARPSAC